MIFVSVGTTNFPFYRMNTLVESISSMHPNEKVIYQHGFTPFVCSSTMICSKQFLPFQLMQKYLKSARIVILQGGPATIFQSIAYGKTPLVLPRQKIYHEHVNDHQVKFSKKMDQMKKVICINSSKNLFLHIAALPHRQKREKNNLKILIKYLNEIINI